MNEQQAERLASNQTLFRAVNEKVAELNGTFGARVDDSATFVCECSHPDCVEQVEMSLAVYAAVHRNPRWFVVAPSDDHVIRRIERVIRRTDEYFVVEKLGVAAAVAEQAVAR
jgi:hypothetical protein